MALTAILVGIAVGILVGLLGIGGGIVLVPALTLLLGFSQQVAQGTSLFMQLPPLGLGALLLYWRKGLVDRWAGAACALGIFLGGYFGSVLCQRSVVAPGDFFRGRMGRAPLPNGGSLSGVGL